MQIGGSRLSVVRIGSVLSCHPAVRNPRCPRSAASAWRRPLVVHSKSVDIAVIILIAIQVQSDQPDLPLFHPGSSNVFLVPRPVLDTSESDPVIATVHSDLTCNDTFTQNECDVSMHLR
jgi:hypothetical protein